jgi:hypothetical protein
MFADGEKSIKLEKSGKMWKIDENGQKVEFIEIYRIFENFTKFIDFWTPGDTYSVL